MGGGQDSLCGDDIGKERCTEGGSGDGVEVKQSSEGCQSYERYVSSVVQALVSHSSESTSSVVVVVVNV